MQSQCCGGAAQHAQHSRPVPPPAHYVCAPSQQPLRDAACTACCQLTTYLPTHRGADYAEGEPPFQCPMDFMLNVEILDWQEVEYRNPGFLELPQVGLRGTRCAHGQLCVLLMPDFDSHTSDVTGTMGYKPQLVSCSPHRTAPCSAPDPGASRHPQQPGGGGDSWQAARRP